MLFLLACGTEGRATFGSSSGLAFFDHAVDPINTTCEEFVPVG
jgi:hypothetical protein